MSPTNLKSQTDMEYKVNFVEQKRKQWHDSINNRQHSWIYRQPCLLLGCCCFICLHLVYWYKTHNIRLESGAFWKRSCGGKSGQPNPREGTRMLQKEKCIRIILFGCLCLSAPTLIPCTNIWAANHFSKSKHNRIHYLCCAFLIKRRTNFSLSKEFM